MSDHSFRSLARGHWNKPSAGSGAEAHWPELKTADPTKVPHQAPYLLVRPYALYPLGDKTLNLLFDRNFAIPGAKFKIHLPTEVVRLECEAGYVHFGKNVQSNVLLRRRAACCALTELECRMHPLRLYTWLNACIHHVYRSCFSRGH